jgi:hypothetical protein
MKQFAFQISVKCGKENLKDCISIFSSLGYSVMSTHGSHSAIISYCGKEHCGIRSLVGIHDAGFDDRHYIDHFNPGLIRDIASACTNDTWQEGELWASSRGKLSRIAGYVGFDVNPNGHRRPTLAEICEHHGYEIKGRYIVKKVETVSNCDKSYCEIARQLDEAKAEIKRLKDENVKLSDMTLYATREMNKYNGLYNSVINREGIVKQLIRDIASELDMDLD